MKRVGPRRVRVQLDPDAYKDLRQRILQRDGWRCQGCGRRSNLEVHHLCFRSRSGDDSEQNLVTLCAPCHRAIHNQLTR